MQRYPHLFSPIRIGSLELQNRIVHEPTDISSSNADGSVSERDIHHHIELAKGGFGLLIVGATSPIARLGRPTVTCLVADGDNYIPGLARLAESIHRYGTPCWVQLQYPGPKSAWPRRDMFTTNDRVSNLYWGSGHEVVYAEDEAKGTTARAMSVQEVLEMVEYFSEAAWRVKQAGFNGVQLHAAHGYLISDFMSPYLNKRTDRFGGSFENRMRFPLAIVDQIQKKCGEDFPISIRYNAIEFTAGGRDLQECIQVARCFENAGVASVDLSTSGAPSVGLDPMPNKEGWNLYISEAVKKEISIPIMISHTLRDPDFCEQALAEGKTDMVGLSRQALADPYWPLKAKLGKPEKIRKCISCLTGCWQHSIMIKHEIGCAVNPACGDVRFADMRPSQKPVKAAIVGGGPAGMEAARIATVRGHTVTIFEKTGELGGAILGCCMVPGKEKMKWYADWLRYEIRDLGVKVKLCHEPTLEELQDYDVVLNATGAESYVPEVHGGRERVIPFEEVMACPKSSCEFYPQGSGRKNRKVGERVLVWGDYYAAADTVAFLGAAGKKVTVVTEARKFGSELELMNFYVQWKRMQQQEVEGLNIRPYKHAVKVIENATLYEIDDGKVVVQDKEFNRWMLEVDDIVSCHTRANTVVLENLKSAEVPTVNIGDSVKPRSMNFAVKEGALAGLTLEERVIINPNGALVDNLPIDVLAQLEP
jgi:2,4-dienoyl-CoA reductase-like NADH-dependent reductase (Old Yellow Enzyme family)/thioredoxin reductase